MKRMAMLVATLMVSSAIAEPVASIEKQAESWPALVDGRPLTKVFRFKPVRIDYFYEGKVVRTHLAVFHINDAEVPADRFAVSLFGSEDDVRTEVEKLLATDDGHVTVEATWVNMPVNFYAPGSAIIGLLHSRSRLLIGNLRRTTPNME